ncbi:MAG: Ger(x)C family spore germination protein [Veillonellales bacterium]
MAILKKSCALLLLLVLAMSTAGCWNRRELNTLGIIGMVSVDEDSNGLQTTFEIIKPEKTGKGGNGENVKSPVKYVQATGSTVIETFRNATTRFDRRLFVSHAKAFLFNEELAKNGLAEHLDMILRDHELRLSMHLVIVKDASAADVMGAASGINTIPSGYIDDLFKENKPHSKGVDSRVIDFLKAYYSKGVNPVISVLQKVKKAKIGPDKSDEYELSTEGAAVFLKDRLVGYLDGPETRGYNWVVGKVASGIVTSPNPVIPGMNSIEILQAKSNNDVEITDDQIKLKVKIQMTGMVDETTQKAGSLEPVDVIPLLEQATADVIKQEVEHTLQKTQTEYKSDIFGFGQLVHQKYPREWKNMQDNWDELFSQATIEVETEVEIIKTGKSLFPVKE